MIYYVIKINFVNNLLVVSTGTKVLAKKGARGSRTRAPEIRKLKVTTALHGAFDRFDGKSFKVETFQQP